MSTVILRYPAPYLGYLNATCPTFVLQIYIKQDFSVSFRCNKAAVSLLFYNGIRRTQWECIKA